MLHTFPISFRKELEQKNEGYVTEYLRKKKTSLDEEKKQWTDKYDQEMAQKVGQINQLKQRLDGIKELRTVAEHKYEDYARRIEAIRFVLFSVLLHRRNQAQSAMSTRIQAITIPFYFFLSPYDWSVTFQ
eukprot:TRINITY_DN8345_c0_g1_i3.p1 TRINITY_DN8345_c0_g1~~TRINITY_DN8345_c0_g1_i3.p1  ORF type:complete len:130 (+),score=13.12 TRINITY_DN8345_c0_g1_i3:66-455(+)